MKYLIRSGVYGFACMALLALSASQASAQYLLDLAVVEGKNANLPAPWQKVNVDLNVGAGGKYLYLFKKTGPQSTTTRPITGVRILEGRNPAVPAGWLKLPIELNWGSGGSYLYLAYTRSMLTLPLTDATVVTGRSQNEAIARMPKGWHNVNVDLNKGAGGQFVYLAVKTVDQSYAGHSKTPVNIDSRTGKEPSIEPFELVVSGGPKQEFIGGFKKQPDYVNKYPVYRRENTAAPAGSPERFLYLYLRDAQQKVWALQTAAPDPSKQANATGQGERPWTANWNPAGIRINPVYAMFIKGTFNANSTRYEERGFSFPAGKDIFIVELYSDTVEGTVYIQDPRGGTVARTQPVNNKGKLKARFEGPLSGLGARIEIVASRRSMGDYLVVVRVKQ